MKIGRCCWASPPPNEYENNINNNWLTNYMAKWCIEFALHSAELAGVQLEQAEREKMCEVAEKCI